MTSDDSELPGQVDQVDQADRVGQATAADGTVAGSVPALAAVSARSVGRHRQHVFPGRGHAMKVLYADDELALVAHAAELTGLRPSSFVAAAALLVARGLTDSVRRAAGDEGQETAPAEVFAGRPVTVAWSAGEDQELLEELVQARLALRRYGVNVNQAAAALNSGGQAPVWLAQAVAGSDRAVARVDEATAALTRRLI